MKKLVFLGAMVMIVGGVALASSINVPFFNDGGTAGYPPSSGTASFIGVHNTTNQDIVLHIYYLDGEAVDKTPTANTVLLKANASRSWRPCINDGQEGVNATEVPDMITTDGKKFGSCTIMWSERVDHSAAEATDVQGRLLQVGPANAGDTATYTLPAGK